ncbi:MAG: hypothetical protein CL853_00980 [Crocinitomicaceae bacterium]|nr:hypothetical protein [Crocinitomicaceae bacterium]|tara:strand:+ start:2644 stop:3471 length:828 start_codon:yes stop_codon:yes gene_type:complete
MWKDFKIGLNAYLKAIPFVLKNGFWMYFIIPIIIFIFIYYLGFYFKDMQQLYKAPDDAGFFKSIYYFFISGIFLLLSFTFLNFIRYIIIILISPLLSIVSERTERILTGNKYTYSLSQLIKDVKRALNLIIRNIVWEMSLVVLVLITLKIINIYYPMNDLLNSTFRIVAVECIAFYYYGFGFIDYIMERLKMNHKQSIYFVRKHRGLAIALGLVFTPLFHYSNSYLFFLKEHLENESDLFILILIASCIIIAIIPILSMVAATIAVFEINGLKKK